MRTRRARPRLVVGGALLLVCGLVLGACGGDDDAGSTGSTKPRTSTRAQPIFAPLTGAVDRTGASATRPALTVKIDNTERGKPQFGLEAADVVYEEIVESGITRLAAMFQSRAPEKIGPIRSVRNTDQSIVWPVGGVFAFSGGARGPMQRISAAPVTLVNEDNAGDAMFRDASRRRPYNLFGVAEKLDEKGGSPVPPPALFTYRAPSVVPAGDPATVFNVGFTDGYDVDWTWDPATGTYKRVLFDRPAVTGTGAQIAPQNVIVQFVDYVGGSGRGGAGAEGSEAAMVGSGEAWVFTGGRLVKGTWQRASKEDRTRFADLAGHDIDLAPGQTFVELLQRGDTVGVA
jgi:hypothetical protein